MSLALLSHQIIEVARSAIEHGLRDAEIWKPSHEGVSPELLQKRGAFVTLFDRAGQLRGCIGTLEPVRPLIDDIAANAWMAAYEDSRFLPLEPQELEGLQIEVSVLSPLKQVFPESQEELFEILVPGETGLLIRKGTQGATFLPSVWAQLPEKSDFFNALKHKAGILSHGWDQAMLFYIYHVEKIRENER